MSTTDHKISVYLDEESYQILQAQPRSFNFSAQIRNFLKQLKGCEQHGTNTN